MSAMVTCAECGASVPERTANLHAQGWQCPRCALQHQIDVHSGADDQIGQISVSEMRQRGERARSYAIFAVLGSVAAALFAWWGGSTGALSSRVVSRLFLAVPCGIAVAAYEVASWRRAMKAVEIMQRREIPL